MNRGEIWQVCFDPTIGAEIRKSRPAIIVSSDAVGVLPLRVVVPVTSWRPEFSESPWLIRLEPSGVNGLSKSSAADAFQVKSVSIQRLLKRVGLVSPHEIDSIVRAIGAVIEHP